MIVPNDGGGVDEGGGGVGGGEGGGEGGGGEGGGGEGEGGGPKQVETVPETLVRVIPKEQTVVPLE